jgi:Putative papain-like cysteine peptidase (DUF1796)
MQKRVFSILLFFSICTHASQDLYTTEFIEWCLQTKEAISQPYYPIISLGLNCQAAYQLRIHGLRYEAFPFDWIICPFDALIALLEDHFEHFLDPQYLEFINTETNKYVLNKYYDIKFVHDFKLNDNFMADYDEVQCTYCRRIERFYQRMKESSRALLIRRKITKSQALQLKNVLEKQFLHTKFLILAVDNSQEIKKDWEIENVYNYFMPIVAGQTWKGDSKMWEELFSLLKLNISCDESKDPLFKMFTPDHFSDSE